MLNKEISLLKEKLAEVSKRLADAQKVVTEATSARAALLRSIASLEEADKLAKPPSGAGPSKKYDEPSKIANGKYDPSWVREAVDRMRGEFSVNEVIEDLMINCPSIQEPPEPKGIAGALYRLQEKQYIKVSQKGSAGKPNKYVRCLTK